MLFIYIRIFFKSWVWNDHLFSNIYCKPCIYLLLIALILTSLDLPEDDSILVEVMTWCHQAIEVWEWTSDFIQHLTDYLSMLGLEIINFSTRNHWCGGHIHGYKKQLCIIQTTYVVILFLSKQHITVNLIANYLNSVRNLISFKNPILNLQE